MTESPEPAGSDEYEGEHHAAPTRVEYRYMERKSTLVRKLVAGAAIAATVLFGIHALDSHNALGPPSNGPGVSQSAPYPTQPPVVVPATPPKALVVVTPQYFNAQPSANLPATIILEVRVTNKDVNVAVDPTLEVVVGVGPNAKKLFLNGSLDGATPAPDGSSYGYTNLAVGDHFTDHISFTADQLGSSRFRVIFRANDGKENLLPSPSYICDSVANCDIAK